MDAKNNFSEIFDLLDPNRVFLNLEQITYSTEALHQKFWAFVGLTPATDGSSNKLLGVEIQLNWLRDVGFKDVDYFWKWLEIVLFVGTKP